MTGVNVRHLTDISGLNLTDEVFETLYERGARVERIVSDGHASEWFDQDHDEWVMVLEGQAELEFADGSSCRLKVGDAVSLPAHLRHRVTWTARPTIWLAVHFQ